MDHIDWRKLQDELSAEVAGHEPRFVPNITYAHNHWPHVVNHSDPWHEYWANELARLGYRYGGEFRMVPWSAVHVAGSRIDPDRSDDDPATLAWRRAGDGLRRYRVGRAVNGHHTGPNRSEMAEFYLALTIPVQPRLPKHIRPDAFIWAPPQVDSMARLAQARPRTPLTPGEIARVKTFRRHAPSTLAAATLARVYRGMRAYRGDDNLYDFD